MEFKIRGQVAFSIRVLKETPKLTYLAFHLRKICVYGRLASKIMIQDLRNATRRAVYSNNKLSNSNLIILFIVQTTIAKKILRKYLTMCFGLFFKCMEIDWKSPNAVLLGHWGLSFRLLFELIGIRLCGDYIMIDIGDYLHILIAFKENPQFNLYSVHIQLIIILRFVLIENLRHFLNSFT